MTEQRSEILTYFRKFITDENILKYGVEDWKSLFSKLLANRYSRKIYYFNPELLYRARLNIDKMNQKIPFFYKTNDLWAPPFKMVKKQGRCNTIGQSLLYCSTHPVTTLFELSPSEDTEVTLIQYKCKSEISPLGIIGADEISLINDKYNKIFGNHLYKKDKKSVDIEYILSLLFRMKSTDEKQITIYNLTNAITQIFLSKEPIKVPDKKSYANIGLIYPSVETFEPLGVNLALNNALSKPILVPAVAYKFIVLRKHGEDFYDIMFTHKTSRIYENGEMKWEKLNNTHVEHITHFSKDYLNKTGGRFLH